LNPEHLTLQSNGIIPRAAGFGLKDIIMQTWNINPWIYLQRAVSLSPNQPPPFPEILIVPKLLDSIF
jgi:hypothetical protein